MRPGDRRPELSAHQRNQIVLCKSRPVLSAALRDPKVANLSLLADKLDQLEWLEKEVHIDFSVAPEIMRISMRGLDTDALIPLVNAIRDAYLKEVEDRGRIVRRVRQTFLGEQIQKYEDSLAPARAAQKAIEDQLGSKKVDVCGFMLAFVQQQLAMEEKALLHAKKDPPRD